MCVSGSFDGTIKVWSLKTYQTLKTLNVKVWTKSLKIKRDLVVAGCGDGTIQVWNLTTGLRLSKMPAHKGPVAAMCVDDKRIISCTPTDGELKIWDFSYDLDTWTKNTFGNWINAQNIDVWTH